jgi:excisionase family DNA binding protein
MSKLETHSETIVCYSVIRVAELLGCSKRHVENLRATGKRPFVRLGSKRVAIRHSDLAAFLDRQRDGGTQDAA